MNILYFSSTDFYRKPNPSYHLMTSMIDDILKEGHKILYAAKAENSIDKHVPEKYLNNPNFEFGLIHVASVNKKSFVKRYFSGIIYAWKSRKIINKFSKKCDFIFVQSTATIFYNVLVAKYYGNGKKIILNIQDMFPGSSIASGVMPYKWMQRIFFAMQKVAYNISDIIVAISEDMKLKLIEQGVSEEKIRVIYNWYDDMTVREVEWDNNRFIKKYSLNPKKFYVQYAGTMGLVFDYKMVIRVAELLVNNPEIEFQMIGVGSQKDDFIFAVEEKKLTNVKFYPLEPQHMVSDVYSACNVCLIPLKQGVIGNSVPSKAGLLMACKRPIITSVDSNCLFANEINNNNIGIACPNDNPESVAEAILNMVTNRQMAMQFGLNGYKYGHELYSRTTNMNKYLNLFKEMIV